MMDDITKFTETDIAESSVLGPEYHASNRLAEAMLAKFDAEHLKPLVDAEHNVAGSVRYMVEQTVEALLTGKEWAMKRYPYADYAKGEEIRAAVAKHGSDELLMRRIADVEAELAKAKEQIQWLRR